MTENGTFDPAAHLTDIQGKDYLEVKWRVVWFRSQHPEGVIETDMIEHSVDEAVFRARVTIPGAGVATGWGAETPGDFGDYLEKAETKALGRALAALGFGTQFCQDFDEGGAVTDSPVARPADATRPRAAATATTKGKVMPLRYAGDCTDCGYRIAQGTQAIYDGSTKTVRHLEGQCVDGGGYQNTGDQQ